MPVFAAAEGMNGLFVYVPRTLNVEAPLQWIVAMNDGVLEEYSHQYQKPVGGKCSNRSIQEILYNFFSSLTFSLPFMIHPPHSSNHTPVTSPSTVPNASMGPNFPVLTSLRITTTRLSSCSPTAARSPALLRINCLGPVPPAAAFSTSVSFPVAWSIPNVMSVSDAISFSCDESNVSRGSQKAFSARDETVTKRLSA
jgi:hypothetical protein